ncbi:TetR/AcrR family transcriptional regulator [Acidaminobacter sp. JC074]|uniref:TetR/AcrR family transcriptional regulator n=1 Tax=Acidaminobacter sp. JC074 TaxID=2530199 RepID=UPI001F1039AC|nr:TetR/AcrR family transcriptional regulator [Acidaminobacter sp. JC074]MCH4886137.1 TetR/AcrR family transcriptional regulator [Acidaminobacter sp. JC074]
MKNKDKILKAALKLFVEYGFHGTSIKNIVDESGVSNGGVYHHFSSKEQIVLELYYKIKNKMTENYFSEIDYDKDIRTVVSQYWSSKLNDALEHPNEVSFVEMFTNSPYVISSENYEHLASQYRPFKKQIVKAMDESIIIRMDPDYLIYDCNSNIDGVLDYIKNTDIDDLEGFLDFAYRKYWRSLLNLSL